MKKICYAFLFIYVFFVKICYSSETPATIMEKFGKTVVLIAGIKNGGEEVGLGSGFIVRQSGVIVTNYHVIENAYPIVIKLSDGDVYDKIFIVDTDKRRDIAVLKINVFGLPAVTLGDSNNIKVGEKIIVIGNPKGLEKSISDGLLSAVRDSGEGYKMYQMTAPISPGSSGSPVFNDKGEVIGIATASLVEGQNLNFCVPINYARGIISETPKMSLEDFSNQTKEVSNKGAMEKKTIEKIVQDEKYGSIPDKYYAYINHKSDFTKRAKVDLAKVFSSYEKTIKYNKFFKISGEDYNRDREERVKHIRQLEKLKNESSLKEEITALKKFDEQARSALRIEQDAKMNEIVGDVDKAISEFGEKNKYKAIYKANQMPYCEEKDISSEIILFLNNQYKSLNE